MAHTKKLLELLGYSVENVINDLTNKENKARINGDFQEASIIEDIINQLKR